MKIKPCPFCGSEAVVYKTDSIYSRTFAVGCTGEKDGSCAGLGGTPQYDERNDAIKQWNRRFK